MTARKILKSNALFCMFLVVLWLIGYIKSSISESQNFFRFYFLFSDNCFVLELKSCLRGLYKEDINLQLTAKIFPQTRKKISQDKEKTETKDRLQKGKVNDYFLSRNSMKESKFCSFIWMQKSLFLSMDLYCSYMVFNWLYIVEFTDLYHCA